METSAGLVLLAYKVCGVPLVDGDEWEEEARLE